MTFQLIQRHEQNCKTPREVYEQLNKEFNFDFDPCPINPSFNGLEVKWGKRVYVNPPYNNITEWLQKAHSEMSQDNSEIVVFLLPVDTSTKWFHNYILGKTEIRFIKGRLRFTNNKPAPFANMVVIFRNPKLGRKTGELSENQTDGEIRKVELTLIEIYHLTQFLASKMFNKDLDYNCHTVLDVFYKLQEELKKESL